MAQVGGAATQQSHVPAGKAQTADEAVRLVQAGRLDEAQACFERLLSTEPKNAEICNKLAMLHSQRGNLGAAAEMFDRAYKLKPFDANIRLSNVRANLLHAESLVPQHRYPEALVCLRRALRCDPGNGLALSNLTDALARSGERAQRSDFVTNPDAPAGTHILIACMPKSGSSFLKEALNALTGWPDAGLTYAYFQNEQEIHLPNLVAVDKFNTVTQQHCRATEANIHILQGFGIRPIVLVRNLPDIVMSLVDFYDGGALINTFFTADWTSLSVESKRDLIIDHIMPWYLGFYVSWRQASANRLDCLFVRYEEMIADKPAALHRIADFLGLGKTEAQCRAAVAAAEGDQYKTRFNRGVAGRGKAALTAAQLDRLRRLAGYYRSTDFSPVGL